MRHARSMTRFSVRVTPGAAAEAFPGFIGGHADGLLEAHLHQERAALIGADGADFGAEFPSVVLWLKALPARDLVLIGAMLRKGRKVGFEARDLLHLDGFSLRNASTADRQKLMRRFLTEAEKSSTFREQPIAKDA